MRALIDLHSSLAKIMDEYIGDREQGFLFVPLLTQPSAFDGLSIRIGKLSGVPVSKYV